jgi:hypothetical protein
MIPAAILNIFARKIQAKSNYLTYRVMFQSPFFEVEVDSGGGWQTVHSQQPEILQDGTAVYQLLRFTSFDDATKYAEETLHLRQLKPRSFFGMYLAPTASYEQRVSMLVQPRRGVLNGVQVSEKEHGALAAADKVMPFRVHVNRTALQKEAA